MTKNDFIHQMKLLAHTARYYFKLSGESKRMMLDQGMRIRAEILAATAADPSLMRDPDVREAYADMPEIQAFRRVALDEERRLAEERNDREVARMEAEREAHRKELKRLEDARRKALEEFDEHE